MLVFDTNVLLYAVNEDSELYDACRRTLEEAREDPSPSYLTWNICYEFMRGCTHSAFASPKRLPEALNFLESLLAAPGFSVLRPTGRHQAVLAQTIDEFPDIRGNFVHDMHIAVLMREHGISRICTRDTGFYRFPFLTVVDPLR